MYRRPFWEMHHGGQIDFFQASFRQVSAQLRRPTSRAHVIGGKPKARSPLMRDRVAQGYYRVGKIVQGNEQLTARSQQRCQAVQRLA